MSGLWYGEETRIPSRSLTAQSQIVVTPKTHPDLSPLHAAQNGRLLASRLDARQGLDDERHLLSAAEIDYTESLTWYAERSIDIAHDFDAEFDRALSQILSDPERFFMHCHLFSTNVFADACDSGDGWAKR